MQTNLHSSDGNQFTNYTANSVTINNVEYSTNIIVTPQSVEPTNWSDIKSLELVDIEELISKNNPDLIIFGTGLTIRMPKPEILKLLQKRQIGFEIMPIPALCRTFNYLMGEGRQVVGIVLF